MSLWILVSMFLAMADGSDRHKPTPPPELRATESCKWLRYVTLNTSFWLYSVFRNVYYRQCFVSIRNLVQCLWCDVGRGRYLTRNESNIFDLENDGSRSGWQRVYVRIYSRSTGEVYSSADFSDTTPHMMALEMCIWLYQILFHWPPNTVTRLTTIFVSSIHSFNLLWITKWSE